MTSDPAPAIRDATRADLPEITAIYRDAVEHGTATYELSAPSLDEMRARFQALTGEGFPFLVAENGGAVAGYAYAGHFRTRPAYRFIVENSIYLAPAAKGRGLGTALMGELIERCRALGFRQVVAVIGDATPASPSVRLHRRLGFTDCGVLKGSGWKHGRWLDTGFMQLALNGGDALDPDPHSLPERRFASSGAE